MAGRYPDTHGNGEFSRAICKQPGRTRGFGSHQISPLNSFFLGKNPVFYTEPFATALANLPRGDGLRRARALPGVGNKPNAFRASALTEMKAPITATLLLIKKIPSFFRSLVSESLAQGLFFFLLHP